MEQTTVSMDLMRALEDIDARVGAGLPPRMRAMVRLRCSHLNGCSRSIGLYADELAATGGRVDLISALARPVAAMREGLASPAEAAALRFAEVLSDAPRGLEARARADLATHFAPHQIAALVEVIALTHAWNRLSRGVE